MRHALRWLWRQMRRVLMLGTLAFGVLLAVLAWSGPAFAQQPPRTHAAQAHAMPSGGPLTPAEQQRAHRRAVESRILFLVSTLYEIVLVGGFLLLGGTRLLARLVQRFGGRWALAALAVAGGLGLAWSLLTLPVDYYAGFIFPHQYGLSNQNTWQWLRDYLVGGAVGVVISLPLVLLFYWLLRRAPSTWWIWLGLASVPIGIFLMLIVPVFVAPLFNKFTPLQDPQLREQILALARQQGIEAKDVFQMDASRQSNAVNAYVVGVGPTQRIVLYDTLLQDFTPDEIKFIMAHEIGHYVMHHIWKGLLVSTVGTFLAGWLIQLFGAGILRRRGAWLGLTALSDPAGLPLLFALSLSLSLLSLPIGNAVSRQYEAQADAFAIRVYNHPAAGISSFYKLARLNISEENPPRWVVILLYTHPSIAQRIAAIRAFERAHSDTNRLP